MTQPAEISKTRTHTTAFGVLTPTCPLCHTLDRTVTADSLSAGETWACTRCGQRWSAARLKAVAAYAQYSADSQSLQKPT